MPIGVYPHKRKPLGDRLARLTDKSAGPDGCWNWTGFKDRKGYGVVRLPDGRKGSAHRATYEALIGPIPAPGCLCHRCDNRACVNPTHVFVGSRADNNFDMYAKKRNVQLRGEQIGTSRLTDEMVRQIRRTKGTSRIVGALFNINPSSIRKIRRGEAWGHVT